MSAGAGARGTLGATEMVLVDDVAELELSDAVPRTEAPALLEGRVTEVGGRLLIDVGALGLAVGKRAKSCLTAVDVGDRVLCARMGGELFVLSVLEGAEVSTRVEALGDLSVAAEGSLSLAGRTVEARSAEDLVLEGAAIRGRARSVLLAADELGLVGQAFSASLKTASVVAEYVESKAERVVSRAKRVFRFVEELEQVRAGVIDQRAQGLAALRGENTIVAARVLTKIDGEQVKIG